MKIDKAFETDPGSAMWVSPPPQPSPLQGEGRIFYFNFRLINYIIPFLLAIFIAINLPFQTYGQSACAYATLVFDTTMPVDADAICQAAKPWADDGNRVLVLLTDFRPENEDAWFDFLDQAEAQAGFRDSSVSDSFARNGVALEFSTSDTAWAQSITVGDALFDSDLGPGSASNALKAQIRNAIAAGNPTEGFVSGLETAYDLANPGTSPLVWGALGLAGAGVLAGGGVAVARAMRPRRERRRQREALQAHLELLRSRTNNLLSASDRLLEGSKPEDTVLYQLFSVYGGERDADMQANIVDWLGQSQHALADAFEVRQRLNDPQIQQTRPLEAQVKDWELLYVTLTGNNERILTLTDEELRTLLDPMLTLDRDERGDSRLARQLDEIRRELTGMPLKVDLQQVDAATVESEGILGYVDRVQGQIAYLREAQQHAPVRLDEAKTMRQRLEEKRPSTFILTAEQLFTVIDAKLNDATSALNNDDAISALSLADDATADLTVVDVLLQTISVHEDVHTQIEALTEKGFRPRQLPDNLAEIKTDIDTIKEKIIEGDFDAAGRWIEELQSDDQRALADAEAWQDLGQQNQTQLQTLKADAARIRRHQSDQVESVWTTLQSYPNPNWADLADGLSKAKETLARYDAITAEFERLNGMEVQAFDQAATDLARASEDLAHVEAQFRAVVNRLAEVETAEQHLSQSLTVAEADIERAEQLRDREDRKIGPKVDENLGEARGKLNEGLALRGERSYIAATEAVTAARNLATDAYTSADEQIQQINDLLQQLETVARGAPARIEQITSEADALPAGVRTRQTVQLTQEAVDRLSEAKRAHTVSTDLEDQAWAEALQHATDAYKTAEQHAEQALQSLDTDRSGYDDAWQQAARAIHQGESAIQQAERPVGHSDAGEAARKALRRARSLLPHSPMRGTPPSDLHHLVSQAEEAIEAAEHAEELARERIRVTQARRQPRRRIPSWTDSLPGSSTGGGWSTPPVVIPMPRGGGFPQMPRRSRPPSTPSPSRGGSMGRSRRF